MLRLRTKIAALKSLKSSSSSTSPYQLLLKRVQRTSSASNKGNFQKLSSLFPPKSTSPGSNRKRALAKPSKNNSKPSPSATNSLKFDAKCCSSDPIQCDSKPPNSSFFHSLSDLVKNKNYPEAVYCYKSGLCNAGNSRAALKLHRQMLNGEVGLGRSCNPTLVSYGSLIDGVCKAGLLVKAKELLLEMKSRGISPNVVVYTSLLNGLCFSGRWEEARLLYREMMDDGVQANVMTLHAVLSSLCKQGKAKKVTELIAQGGDPTDVLHKILMEIGGN